MGCLCRELARGKSESGDLGEGTFGDIGTTYRPDPARQRRLEGRAQLDGIDGPEFPRKGAIRFALTVSEINLRGRIGIAGNADLRQPYGAPPTCLFQQEAPRRIHRMRRKGIRHRNSINYG